MENPKQFLNQESSNHYSNSYFDFQAYVWVVVFKITQFCPCEYVELWSYFLTECTTKEKKILILFYGFLLVFLIESNSQLAILGN